MHNDKEVAAIVAAAMSYQNAYSESLDCASVLSHA